MHDNYEQAMGVAYSNRYYRHYSRYQHATNQELVLAIVNIEKELAVEPVGTEQWHDLIGALVALSVLLPHGALSVTVK